MAGRAGAVGRLMNGAIDSALGAGAVMSPMWLQYANAGGQTAMIWGGVILLGMRLYRMWKRLKELEKQNAEDR